MILVTSYTPSSKLKDREAEVLFQNHTEEFSDCWRELSGWIIEGQREKGRPTYLISGAVALLAHWETRERRVGCAGHEERVLRWAYIIRPYR